MVKHLIVLAKKLRLDKILWFMFKCWRQFVWLFLCLCLLVLGVIAALLFNDRPFQQEFQLSQVNNGTDETPAKPVVNPLAPLYVVLIGYGGAGHDGAYLADTLIVAQILPEQQKINLFNLPRDLWVALPFPQREDDSQPFYTKINTAYAYGQSNRQFLHRPAEFQGSHGGGALMKKVISQVIGQEINYFAAVDFDTFKKVIDIIAGNQGLAIDSPFAFSDPFYPLDGKENDPCGFSEAEIAQFSAELKGFDLEKKFTCRYEEISFPAGKQFLSAEQALKYARSRHAGGAGGGDFSRSRRQQVIIEALKKELLSVSVITKIPQLWSKISQLLKSDLDWEIVSKALFSWKLADFDLTGHVISDQNFLQANRAGGGQYVLLPKLGQDNYEAIHQFVSECASASTAAALNSQ